ncbi:V-type ATP synthase subunit C [Caloramator sp. E03]|uniref:V-type ATP synthase subunit C n=1 Tax=Caloramator sp. E03 TaxID=2576307 RepID=UPI00111048D7|nr:V-type ATP synthase subunit C [Caloramator sp. E03]QCX33009.1 V-type ATP synthase subunit C [Caloramator sp. E03]
MDNTIFAQSIARIRSLETKMIDKAKIEAMVEARDFNDCLRFLQDTQYGSYLLIPSYEEGLKKATADLYREMYKISPIKEVVDILALRYDGHNIKSLIKGKLSGIDTLYLTVDAGTIPLDKLVIMIKEENFRDLPKTLRSYVEKAFENYKNHQDPQEIDITIDKGIYAYMLEIAENSKMEYLLDIVRLMIDIINIKSFIRVNIQERGREFMQKVFLPGGRLDKDLFINNVTDSLESFTNKIIHTDHFKWIKEGIGEYIKKGDLGSIEKYGDNFIIDYLKKAKLVSFGPDPLIAYILARENEIKIIRIILTGKKNEVSPDIIRERLRDVYV